MNSQPRTLDESSGEEPSELEDGRVHAGKFTQSPDPDPLDGDC